jgi:hypothetical protein
MDTNFLAQEYETMSDEELLRLSLNPEQLTPEAKMALQSALLRRNLVASERVEKFRAEEEERSRALRNNIGKLFMLHPFGIGRKFYGKAARAFDSQTKIERFKTTVFLVFFWLPLIPTSSFVVERKRAFLPGPITVLERIPLDWEQVLKVWIMAAFILLALIWFLRLLPAVLYRAS